MNTWAWTLLPLGFAQSLSARAAPLNALDNPANIAGSASSSPLQVTNFQDLSAVLSLLASDAVERKLSSCASSNWERMTTVWSLFGMIGVLRTYLKIAFGLAGSQRAGIDLAGAGTLTSKKTDGALSTFRVASTNDERTWQDNTDRLIGYALSLHSPWIRPHIIVIGYSQCPFHGQWMEVLIPLLWTILTAIFTTFPGLILINSIRHPSHIDIATLVLLAGIGVIGGSIIPSLLVGLNPPGVLHLEDVEDSRFSGDEPTAAIIRPNDMVITSTPALTSHIIWQQRNSSMASTRRSGDILAMRAFCAFGAVLILAGYLFNYILLGEATAVRSYIWLAAQIAILMIRYILWAHKPAVFPTRSQALLYVVTGSLTATPLALNVSQEHYAPTEGPRLQSSVVDFAVASAGSKVLNAGGGTGRIRYSVLKRLCDTAPADILCSEYVSIPNRQTRLENRSVALHAVRLPWSFVEELYAAQNVILGSNPWALGGLYLAALLEDDKYIGLTTVHPIPPDLKHDARIAGITQDGYAVDDLTYGAIGEWAGVEKGLGDWHSKFRDNINTCRSTARTNGPSHMEIHVWNYKPGQHASKTEKGLDLDFAKQAARHARTKNHDNCLGRHCGVLDFDPRS